MRISHIGQHEFPEDGAAAGIDAHVKAVSLRLVRHGHDVTVYTYERRPTTNPALHAASPRIRPLPTVGGKLLSPLLHALSASMASAMSSADIVHFHGPGSAVFAWLPRLAGKKVLTSFHGLDWKRRKWGVVGRTLLRAAEVNAVRASHQVVCDSHEVQAYCADRYAIHAEAIPNGAERFPRQKPNLIRERFGLKPDGFILYLGRLVPEKRVHWLIEAYSALRALPPLVIAGCGDYTAAYVNQLRKRADSLAPHRVIFTGRADRRMAQELYSNARLFVLPSEVEGCPIALLEAMSAGCPCLASDIPPHREILVEGGTGWLFKSHDPSALAEKLAHALASTHRRAIGRRARAEVLGRWTWDETTARTILLYRSMVNGAST